jgi:hypothetical protein
MNSHHPNADAVICQYLRVAEAPRPLGWGVDGVVYPSPNMTAIKVHSRIETYWKEVAAYQRLQENGVMEFQGFAVPCLVRCHTWLQAIEMSIVSPPCLLDFAATTIDFMPDFPEGLDEWWDRVRDDFGDDFPIAESVFWGLQRYGIYYWDLKPRNLQIR